MIVLSFQYSGRLFLKSELEKRKDVIFSSEENSFRISTLIPRVAEMIDVTVHYDIFEDEYIQFLELKITYSSADMGPKRLEALDDIFKEKFHKNESLHAPLKVDNCFYYGFHKFFSNSKPKKAIKVEIVDNKKFELLATDIYVEDGVEFQHDYFYCPERKKVFERALMGESKKPLSGEEWFEKFPQKTLHKLDFKDELNEEYAVDETGYLYRVYSVKNPNNIRIFSFIESGENIHLRTLRSKKRHYRIAYNYNKKEKVMHYKEFLKKKEDASSLEVKLPLKVDSVTIHSNRVIGNEVNEIPQGTWVKTVKGTYGIIGGNINCKAYPLVLEGDYRNKTYGHGDYIHDELEIVDEPILKYENEKPVTFKVAKSESNALFGFGYIFEETPNFYKVRPLDKKGSLKSNYIQNVIYYAGDAKQVSEMERQTKEIHGQSNFIFVPKEDIVSLSEEKEADILDYYQSPVSNEEKMFENILRISPLNVEDYDNILSGIHSYLKFEDPITVSNKVLEILLEESSSNAKRIEKFNKLFEKNEKINNLKKTS